MKSNQATKIPLAVRTVLLFVVDSVSSPYANVEVSSADCISLSGGLGKEAEFDRRKKKK